MADINKLPDDSHEPGTKTPKKKKKKDKVKVSKRVTKWFRELRSELKKVTWPTRKQTVNNTVVALVVMVFSAICIWGFDRVASLAVQTLITLVG